MAVGFPTKVDYATGDVLSAGNMNDLSGTVNLLESAQYAAGKNKIINGDFRINQRQFTTPPTSGNYGFDRWNCTIVGDGTATYSAQTFTPGTAPVSGYEAVNFARFVTSGQTTTTVRTNWSTLLEDVRIFAGETVTFSLWAKAASGTPKLFLEIAQNFGSGGSSPVITSGGQVTLSTSWARYSVTISIPSISGKTIGTSSFLNPLIWVSAGSDFNARTGSLGIQNNTFDIWGVQLEAGSTASAFQTATGTIQGELAACQRYYYRTSSGSNAVAAHGFGTGASTTIATVFIRPPVTMRIIPSSIEYSTLMVTDSSNNYTNISNIVISGNTSQDFVGVDATIGTASLTQFRGYFLRNNVSSSGYIALSAEL
jgi:hypothetical protein